MDPAKLKQQNSAEALLPLSLDMARSRLNLSDEELRERRNAADRKQKRRKATEDPEYRAKRAAYMRRLRAERSEYRAREALAKRESRLNDPGYRARQAAHMRRLRAERSEYRAREARAKRERRLNDPGLRVVESYLRQVRRCEANGRRKSLSSDSGHGCHVCGRLGSDANLSTLSSALDRGKRRNAAQLPRESFPALLVGLTGTNFCETCRESLLQDADRSDDNNRTCAQEHGSEEVICGMDTFNTDLPSESCSASMNSEIALLVPKREPEEIDCAVDCLDGYLPTRAGHASVNSEIALLVPKREPEEIDCAVDCLDGYLPTRAAAPTSLGPLERMFIHRVPGGLRAPRDCPGDFFWAVGRRQRGTHGCAAEMQVTVM
ncbi:uncharacterized protein LOC119164467 isoform X2 [Rhipicephalus microplus]|uniref:uncharacterized protein LOC119164467 isoform X2 n=1 Tax=Rhipicephalus microplus TaxID=6941 RepID=UPI003F6CCC95